MIRFLLIFATFMLAILGQDTIEAPVITGNEDVTYTASLSNSHSSSIHGAVTVTPGSGGVGLLFRVFFTGLPEDAGPFPYHIHVLKVPSNGSCAAAGSHLDPYHRGEDPPCNSAEPATCQLGDLSGKHELAIVAPGVDNFSAEYTDFYLSDRQESIAYIGNLSVVIHASNGTRLNCGNFELDGHLTVPSTRRSSTSVASKTGAPSPSISASTSATPTRPSVVVDSAAKKSSTLSLETFITAIMTFFLL
ncbi:superoxide dismutase [Talaromyces proteolyticus]|uniref:superoxide dismutase n=1 Tax=Talaromyces proteolyticus TaxID=1131652 RepID=A0AAD4KR13_9EURO|nr:superoxide dismutase [Talaromyces proteolyticus]KAH8697399.1 superoxide dismutase [Talaromyces proteolyticus]